MQWEERKGWISRSWRVGRNAMVGKERMDYPEWEMRKECKRRKGNNVWPEMGEEEGIKEEERKG
jgi:hypothetical protein